MPFLGTMGMPSDFGDLYRVPVRRVPAALTLADGSRREGILFVGCEDSVGAALAGPRTFFPFDERGAVRIYAVAAVACISSGEVAGGADPSERALRVRVHLQSGVILEGEVRFIPSQGKARLLDALSEDAPSFVLVEARAVHHVQKAHVLLVEELS